MTDLPLDLQVWDAAACARYMSLTREYFLRETRHIRTFPPVLKEFQNGHPRWSAKAVIAWALRS